jgi:hypothetical protein
MEDLKLIFWGTLYLEFMSCSEKTEFRSKARKLEILLHNLNVHMENGLKK